MGKRATQWLLGIALLAALLPADLAAQERRITGRVFRAGSDQPIPNAAVTVVGATRAAPTFTDTDGRFTIAAPTAETRLAVQAFGFIRMEVTLAAGVNSADIALQQDVFRLDEVVVTGQATTVERRSATTAVAIVSGEELTKVSSPTILNALTGKISGVNLQTNSGAPGGGIQLQIRGNNTILGAYDPLFVVDGVIYSNASIPTGRGVANAAGSATQEDDAVNRIADLNPEDIASIEVLKGAAASSIYGSKAANGVVVITTTRGQSGAPQFNISQRIGVSSPLKLLESRRWTLDEAIKEFAEKDPDLVRPFFANNPNPYFDQYAQFYDNRKLSHETTADMKGGSATTRYYISGNLKRDEGIERYTGASRKSLRINLDQDLGSQLDLRISSVFNRSENDRGWDNNCNSNNCGAYAFAYIPSFIDLTKKNADGTYPKPPVGPPANPMQLAELAENHEVNNRFTGGFTLGWNAYQAERQSLRLVAGGGFDIFDQTNTIWSPNDLFYEQTQSLPGDALVSGARSLYNNWNVNAIHSWDGGALRTTTSFGLQYEDRWLHTTQMRTRNLLPGQRNVNRGTNTTATENLTQERTIALYASEAVRFFDDRLLLQGGGRAERSSANGDIEKYYVYPNVSASYRFLDLIGSGSEMKLRAAYGETGNQPLFGQKFTNLATPQLGGQQGITVSTTSGFADVSPERLKEVEVGLDGNAFGGRLTWELTGFDRNTTNLLLQRVPAPSSGFAVQIFNGGKIRNTGVEAALGYTPIRSGTNLWVTRATFTRYTSEVVDLAGLPAFYPPGSGYGNLGRTRIEQGLPITAIVGFDLNPDGTRGSVIKQLGNSAPDFRVGFVNDVTFGPLNVNAVLDWQQGGSVINLTRYLQDDGKTSADWGTEAWKKRYQGYLATSIRPYIEDATFLKVREVAVTYGVPVRLTKSFGLPVNNLRLGVTGRNLFMWTKYSGVDPEVANFGSQAVRGNLDIGPYPPSRSFFFNISVGF
jgi:TonB-linked SusC/RagA family outer membrane protein